MENRITMENAPSIPQKSSFNAETLREVATRFLSSMSTAGGLSAARERLYRMVSEHQFDTYAGEDDLSENKLFRVRDCARALKFMLKESSDRMADFSVAKALYDISRGEAPAELEPGFYAEMIHLFLGLQGLGLEVPSDDIPSNSEMDGRRVALARSDTLDKLWTDRVEERMSKFSHGLQEDVQLRRVKNRDRILARLGGSESDWLDWHWQTRRLIRTVEQLSDLIPLSPSEYEAVRLAKEVGLPFGITPYYVSLMDNDDHGVDRAVRAQVIPTLNYVQSMTRAKGEDYCTFDFMLEKDTSPVDLVTRRYPAIVILKPYNSCPQICVYCQRNWEIDDALSRGAMASRDKILEALDWIRQHPAIHEVLITGGDPLSMNDNLLKWVLEKVAEIPTIERIRIGTRTLVTLPMRFTPELVDFLGSLRVPMKREVSVVTHIEHPYEITPVTYQVVEMLRGQRINVYNQNVFTFFVSRKFEAALMRRLLKRIGVEPYYTFNTKGKDETVDFRVPIARLLQESNEESRLLPGLSRTDEGVYNVPGLGKNYLRAAQHRDVLSVLPDGSRVYNFHPWEKNIRVQNAYVGTDVPILDYLDRLERLGEDVADYETIWYYY